jgi:hypothetical protein
MQQTPNIENTGKRGQMRHILFLVAVAVLLLAVARPVAADPPAVSVAQVEAVFLFNFAKYVDWPATAFPNPAAPITIGVVGTDVLGDSLDHIVAGKSVNGRPFAVKHFSPDADFAGCQILFIGNLETSAVTQILDKTSTLPILTVSDAKLFAQDTAIIGFVLKDQKVRLAIDLDAARKAGLTISSKLLAVADVVRRKSN